MSSIHSSITIKAAKEKVWNTMLQQETYRIWTAEFGAGSCFEGSWEEGQKIRFLGPDGSGGIASVIAENQPYRYLSIKHLGIIKDGVEDMESPDARTWASAYENYTFTERADGTELKVEMSGIPAKFEQYMTDTWPKALAKLKSLCE